MSNNIKCCELFERIDEIQKEYVNFLGDICKIESPTDYKEGVDKCGKYIIDKAVERGWKIAVQKQEISGDAICITMNPDAKGEPVCYSGHIDTVHAVGLFGENPVRIEGDRLYGPGAVDCKGGIAASFCAMAALEDVGFTSRPVKLIIQSDEENGSRFSNKTTVDFMEQSAKGCIAFLNTEKFFPGKSTCLRKGIVKYRFEIEGKAIHASKCFEGASAVCEAAYKIIELEKMKDNEGLTCNCGLINGGTSENTVPEKCVFTADIRFPDADAMNKADKFVREIAAKSFVDGTKCTVTQASMRVAMPKSEANLKLLEKINDIFSENDIPTLEAVFSFGGSDAADMTTRGITCLDSFGIEGENAHKINEYAIISSIAESAKRLAAIAYCI